MIKISNLSKRFGNKVVLDDVSINIEEGEIFILLGKSGMGKSVIIKHIVGLIAPDSGSVEIDGINLFQMDAHELEKTREKFGVLFQSSALLDSLNVEENVGVVLTEKYKLPKREVQKQVAEVLEKVSLSGTEKLKTSELSGGMKKRVGLARAIVTKPKYIFYDEPTTGLDPVMSGVIDDLIMQVSREFNITSVVVTHDLETVFKIGTSVAFLGDGKIRFAGYVEELETTKNEYVRAFLNGRIHSSILPPL